MVSISDTRDGRRASEDSKLVIGLGKKRKTNMSQAVTMTLKKIIYIREPRTSASNLSMTQW